MDAYCAQAYISSQTLRVTPAMEAGISDHVWSVAELVGLLEHNVAKAAI
jgi:hypothetical protein